MGWIKVSDDFYDNDKMLAAGNLGRDLYWHGMAFCNRNLTDGLVPRGRALSLVDWTGAAVLTGTYSGVDGHDCAPIAVELVLAAGLWHEDGHDCPDCVQPGPRHYIIHDYLKYQPSRTEVEAKRAAVSEARAAAGRAGGLKSAQTRRSKAEANGQAKTKQTSSKSEAPNPNPNPSTSPLVTKEGEVALRNAHEANPRPQCSKHPNGNHEGACRGCMKVRQWDEANAAAVQADELEAKRRAREIAERCPDCHGTNLVEIGEDEVIKCNHNQKELQA